MKELKFKAYIKSLGWVVPVNRIYFDEEYVEVILNEENKDTTIYDFNEIDLKQYTGVKDFKGKEIYEGDVFEIEKHGLTGIVRYGLYKDNSQIIAGFYIDFEGDAKDFYRKDLGYWAKKAKITN